MKYYRKHQSAFTIVELLIVIVVIGILAAITIVAYNGIQSRSYATSAQSDFSNISKKVELFKADSATAQYPTTLPELTTANITLTKSIYDAVLWCSTGTQWSIVADVRNGKSYYYNSSSKSFAEFTDNKVQGVSGGTTCPPSGVTGGSWQWLRQVPTGAWAI